MSKTPTAPEVAVPKAPTAPEVTVSKAPTAPEVRVPIIPPSMLLIFVCIIEPVEGQSGGTT